MRVVIEAGTHSLWVSRLLAGLGHEVLVANPRKVRLISDNEGKDDPVYAELLARLGVRTQLVSPEAPMKIGSCSAGEVLRILHAVTAPPGGCLTNWGKPHLSALHL